MTKSQFENSDRLGELRIYPQPPKYKIGDWLRQCAERNRIPNTNIYVRGVMTDSMGKHRYLLQINDNSMVVEELELASTLSIVTYKHT